MNIHSFDIEFAKKYGIEEAILFYNISYWIEKNKANEKNFYDGKYWTYNSTEAFAKMFPYMSKTKIYRALKKLELEGILIVGNYNKLKVDRTKWFSVNENTILPNCKMHLVKLQNAFSQNETTIPNINTDINTDIKHYDDFNVFWETYNKKVDKKRTFSKWKRLTKKDRSDILEMLDKYIEATPNPKYRKNPLTFLNGEVWKDEVIELNKSTDEYETKKRKIFKGIGADGKAIYEFENYKIKKR
jgi:hypothetical protein